MSNITDIYLLESFNPDALPEGNRKSSFILSAHFHLSQTVVRPFSYNLQLNGIDKKKSIMRAKEKNTPLACFKFTITSAEKGHGFNPLRTNNDLSQTSPCNIKGLSVSEVMGIENMITQVQFY